MDNSLCQLWLIVPLGRLDKRTRLAKFAAVCATKKLALSVICWERKKGESQADTCYTDNKTVLLSGGVGAGTSRGLYVLWILKLIVHLIKVPKGSKFYCLGFECAFPVYFVSRFKDFSYIFDDADRFSLIVNPPQPLLGVLRFIERKVSEGSDLNIIPGQARYEFKNTKQKIVRNFPSEASIKNMERSFKDRDIPELLVYVNGWLGNTRGLPIILKVAKKFNDNNYPVNFVCAGRVDGDSASEFVQLPNVNYIGEVDSTEALSWYPQIDLVFTYYDPSVLINQFAESNKWGDAICFGVPVLVNAEVKTADFLRKADACISVPYADDILLYEKLLELAENTDEISRLAGNVKTLQGSIRYFDQEIGGLLEEFIQK